MSDDKLEKVEQEELVALPGEKAEASDFEKSLVSESIDEVILQKQINNVLLKETENIITPAYMLDFSTCDTVLQTTIDFLGGLVLDMEDIDAINKKREERGESSLVVDTALYIKNYEGVILAGMGDGYEMYRQLENFIKTSFGDKVKIYKNNGNGFTESKKNDVTSVKLKLA